MTCTRKKKKKGEKKSYIKSGKVRQFCFYHAIFQNSCDDEKSSRRKLTCHQKILKINKQISRKKKGEKRKNKGKVQPQENAKKTAHLNII